MAFEQTYERELNSTCGYHGNYYSMVYWEFNATNPVPNCIRKKPQIWNMKLILSNDQIFIYHWSIKSLIDFLHYGGEFVLLQIIANFTLNCWQFVKWHRKICSNFVKNQSCANNVLNWHFSSSKGFYFHKTLLVIEIVNYSKLNLFSLLLWPHTWAAHPRL